MASPVTVLVMIMSIVSRLMLADAIALSVTCSRRLTAFLWNDAVRYFQLCGARYHSTGSQL